MVTIRRVLLLLVLLAGGLWTFTSPSGAQVCVEALSDCEDASEESPTPSPEADDPVGDVLRILSPEEGSPEEDEAAATPTPRPTPRASAQSASCGPGSPACGQIVAQQPTSTPTAEPDPTPTPPPEDDTADEEQDETKDDGQDPKDEGNDERRTGVGGKGDLPTSGAPLQAYGFTGLALLHLGVGFVLAERLAQRKRTLRGFLAESAADLGRRADALRSAAADTVGPAALARKLGAANAVGRSVASRLVLALLVGSLLLAMTLPAP